MCRWGCTTIDTTYMCKWCGTRYCKECLHGDFSGVMTGPTKCRKCFQPRCQGPRVEYVPRRITSDDEKGKRGRGKSARGKSAKTKRGKSAGKKGRKKK